MNWDTWSSSFNRIEAQTRELGRILNGLIQRFQLQKVGFPET